MKRSIIAVLLACAGLSGASCSDSEAQGGIAGLSGTYDLTFANGFIFVTSSDRDELRVLDLKPNQEPGREPEPREYVPAPNPLEALSIPVLERPDDLTHDDDFGGSGEGTVPYVYARSSGSREISVVAAERERLVEVRRLSTGGLITAFAARAPTAARASSVLYYALQTPPPPAPAGVTYPVQCGFGAIMRQELPGPDELAATEPPPPVPVFCLFERESVAAMTVMPQEGRFVVGTRSTTNLPPALPGRTLLLSETVGIEPPQAPQAPVDLSAGFEGSPVRLLATHPQVLDYPETKDVDESIPPGRFIFGLRDEAACGGGPQCSGVLAVESATGARATDAGGAEMFPIGAEAGIPTGMAIVPDGRVLLRFAEGLLVRPVPLLGLLPSSNGSITVFSASGRRHFDMEPATPDVAVQLRDAREVVVRDSRGLDITREAGVVVVGQPVEYVRDPNTPGSRRTTRPRSLFEGSVPNATFRIVFQGVFPGLAGLERDLANPAFFEVAQSEDPRKQVAVGDVIVLEGDEAICGTDLLVRAVVPTTAGRVRLETSTPIPDVCAGLPRFSVLAAGTEPLMLLDGTGNLLARDLSGNTAGYAIPTSYYFHPVGFQSGTMMVDDAPGSDTDPNTNDEPWQVPAFPKPPPPLTLSVESNIEARLVRGDRFVVDVNSGVRTFVFGVNTGAGGLTLYTLPGPVAAPRGGGLAYIAYPSADGVLQVNMEQLQDNALNTTTLNPFE